MIEMLIHKLLHVFRESRVHYLAKYKGRSSPFLDHSVDEGLLHRKWIISRQFTGTSSVIRKPLRTIITEFIKRNGNLLMSSFHNLINVNCFLVGLTALVPFLALFAVQKQKCSPTKMACLFGIPLKRAEIWCCRTDRSAEFLLCRTNGLEKTIFIWDSPNFLSKVTGKRMKKGNYFATWIIGRWFG